MGPLLLCCPRQGHQTDYRGDLGGYTQRVSGPRWDSLGIARGALLGVHVWTSVWKWGAHQYGLSCSGPFLDGG